MSVATTLYDQEPTTSNEKLKKIVKQETLADLLYKGFYLNYLLRRGWTPATVQTLTERVNRFLDDFERRATRRNFTAEDIYDAKYAFCATLDESVLSKVGPIRDEWELEPLQLRLFGDQLAGEHFFDKLDAARQRGKERLPALEVFHLCLLLGFKGKYLLEGPEKLSFYTRQVGEQIAHIKGTRAAFAPHWMPPDHISHRLKRNVPAWAVSAVLAVAALVGYLALRNHADVLTAAALAPYQDIVALPPSAPHVTITLP